MSRSFRAVAVQPKWEASDFTTTQAFQQWMRGQLETARPHLSKDKPNLVVLTELNGLPLVLRGGGWALRFATFKNVASALFLARAARALPLMQREKISPIRALQLAGAEANARLYLHTCRDLAVEFGVYLCCGSAPMPRYQVINGKLHRAPGVLTNQTILFDPQGHLIGATDKVHLTPDEEAGGVDLTPGDLAEMRVFPTPVGDLGVAISLDAFRADVIEHLEQQGCTVLLQPDANGSPWTALEGLPPDPHHIRDQPLAWLDSSWTATTTGQTIRYAVNPMVVGNLLDLTFDGQSAITGRLEDTTQARSYVLTSARQGFLALAPWVAEGTPDHLRQLGQQMAAQSHHPRENQYLTGIIHADLTLPNTTLTPPRRTPHEEALEFMLQTPAPRQHTSAFPWLILSAAVAYAIWHKRRRR